MKKGGAKSEVKIDTWSKGNKDTKSEVKKEVKREAKREGKKEGKREGKMEARTETVVIGGGPHALTLCCLLADPALSSASQLDDYTFFRSYHGRDKRKKGFFLFTLSSTLFQ